MLDKAFGGVGHPYSLDDGEGEGEVKEKFSGELATPTHLGPKHTPSRGRQIILAWLQPLMFRTLVEAVYPAVKLTACFLGYSCLSSLPCYNLGRGWGTHPHKVVDLSWPHPHTRTWLLIVGVPSNPRGIDPGAVNLDFIVVPDVLTLTNLVGK